MYLAATLVIKELGLPGDSIDYLQFLSFKIVGIAGSFLFAFILKKTGYKI